MNTTRRVTTSMLGLALALAATVFVTPDMRAATAQSSCFQAYWGCAERAANLPTFRERTTAGLDCAVDLVSCVRRAIFG